MTNSTPTVLAGTHRLWGYSETFDAENLHQRIFGFLVQMAAPVVKEFHSDLFHDARWLAEEVTGAGEQGSFLFCVRHSGTNIGRYAKFMYDSLAYDAALYALTLTVERGVWSLTVDVLGTRPTRPIPDAMSADTLGLNPV